MSTAADKTVLLVEDEAIVSMHLSMIIEELGFRVVGTAATGAEAIRLALEHRPDVVLMDVTLRGGMSGVEAAEQIRSSQEVRIVYVTAHSAEDLAAELGLSPRHLLQKPITAGALEAVLARALEATEGRDG